jgi:PAS domain S-box-containing protein
MNQDSTSHLKRRIRELEDKNARLRQAEQELQKKEKESRITLNSIGDAVISTDLEGRVIQMNQVAQNLTGWNIEEAKGKPMEEVFHLVNAITGEKAENPVKQVLSSGETVGLANDTKLVAKDGSELQIADSAAPVSDDQGRLFGVVAVFRDVTEDYRKNKQIKEYKEFLDAVFNSIQDGVSVLNTDLTIHYVNPVMEKWYSENMPLVGRKCYKIYHNSSKKCDPCPSLRCMETKKTESEVIPGVPDPNSSVKWLELYSYPIIDNDSGEVTGVVEFVRDVTQRIKDRKQLASQKERLANIIEGTDAGTWEWNVQTGETIFNERWAEFIGYSLEELSPTTIDTWMEHAHSEDLEKCKKEMERHFRGKTDLYECEHRMKHKDGSWIWLLDRGKVVSWTEDGKPLWMFGTHQNITERKETEIKLQGSENHFRLLIENAPEAIFIQTEGKFAYVNQQGLELFGADKAEQLIGMPVMDRFHPDYHEDVKKRIKGLNQSKEPQPNLEEIYLKLDGTQVNVEVSAVPFRYQGKDGALVFARDITERKKAQRQLQKNYEELEAAEEELRASNEELSDLNSLLNRQKEELKKAKEKAEESDRLKSAFLANMSHEIRTPMNGIMGFSQMLQDREFPRDKQKKFLEIIHSRTQHLLNIINDLVDLSKIEANQLTLNFQQFNLKEVLQELYSTYQNQLKNSEKDHIQLEMNLDLNHEKSHIESDFQRLRQIMDNLLNNALKFTDEGKIEFGYSFKEDHTLLFYVKDTGIGISSEKKDFVFERFRQVDDSSTRLYEGTGLGLTISKNLIEILGGEMWVESEKGEGSVFYFTLPYKSHNIEKEREDEGESTDYNWEGKNLLIVEDDPTSLEYMKEILEPIGAELILKPTGEEGYSAFKDNPHLDLILMDIRLPDTSGIEIIKRIRQTNKDVRIIAQTAHALEEDRNICLQAGADDYIAKPIEISELLKIINKYI